MHPQVKNCDVIESAHPGELKCFVFLADNIELLSTHEPIRETLYIGFDFHTLSLSWKCATSVFAGNTQYTVSMSARREIA